MITLITNLLAVVCTTIVTNTTEANITENIGCPYGAGCLVMGCDRQAKYVVVGKTVTTEIVEETAIAIDSRQLKALGWQGGLLEGKQRRVLSSTSRIFKREDNWIEK